MPAASQILFINKTAGSGKLSQSIGSERAQIYSHVQRGSHNRLPIRQSKEPACLYQLPDSWSPESGSDGSQAARPSGKQQRKSKKKAKAGPPSDTLERSPKQAASFSLDILSGGAGDPFDSLREKFDPYMEDLFKFYSSDVVPRIFPIKDVANVARVYTITQALEDPLQRDALLCTTSAAIYGDSGVEKHGIAAMKFKGRALSTLQKQLSQGNMDTAKYNSSMYAVALLLFVECLQGNVDALAAHTRGLYQLVANASNAVFEGPLCIFATLFACHYLCAALLDDNPTLEPIKLAGAAKALSEKTQSAVTAAANRGLMATRFFSTSAIELMGPKLNEIALRQRNVMLHRHICMRERAMVTVSDVQHMYNEEITVEYELTALRGDETLSPAQNAIRLALFVFPQPFILVAKPHAAFCRAMTKQMKKWLERSNLCSLWAPRCDMLLWVLFVTAHISIGEAEWPWVLTHLSTIISFLGLESVEQIEEVLGGFYYHPDFFRVTLERIWDEHQRYSPV